jgi:hypothetical protein
LLFARIGHERLALELGSEISGNRLLLGLAREISSKR